MSIAKHRSTEIANADTFASSLRKHLNVGRSELAVLCQIHAYGPSSLSVIAGHVGLSRAAMTTLADRLATTGMIERSIGKDRRTQKLSFTNCGLNTFEMATVVTDDALIDDIEIIDEPEAALTA